MILCSSSACWLFVFSVLVDLQAFSSLALNLLLVVFMMSAVDHHGRLSLLASQVDICVSISQ